MIDRERYKGPSGERFAYYVVTCEKGCHGSIAFTTEAASALEGPLERACGYDASLQIPFSIPK